jgi:3'-5' exoribonuclease
MKSQFVQDLKPNDPVNSVFIVRGKTLREKRDGSYFLSLELADKTGTVSAILWDRVEEVNRSVRRDDVVAVTGIANTYQDRLQITLSAVRKAAGKDVDPRDFLPVTPRDIEAMRERLLSFARGIENRFLASLVRGVFEDPDLGTRFLKAPAATRIHQPYLGGLLEHTLNVVEICEHLKGTYPGIDADLLLTGAILHDVGKIEEYEYERTIGTTDEGRLIGHLVLGFDLIDQRAREIQGFPAELRLKLGHMILSHHGELEWGSPKVPMLLEAILLHHADNLDAKVDIFKRAMESARDPESRWSDFQREISRYIFLGSRDSAEDDGRMP